MSFSNSALILSNCSAGIDLLHEIKSSFIKKIEKNQAFCYRNYALICDYNVKCVKLFIQLLR